MKRSIFTICSANYLATAKVLMDSLQEHEPNSHRVLVLVEREWDNDRLHALERMLNCEVLPMSRLTLPDATRMAFQYDVTELNTAVKPFVFQELFARGDGAVIYLDPDIKLYQPLGELWKVLGEHEAVVTPHITEPLPDDGLAPTTENMIRCGQYNFGFLGLAKGEHVSRFLDWWAERLTDHCIFHPHHFYFVDQFYGALVSSFIPTLRVWHHHGYNFAYWNALQRHLERGANADWMTSDGKLVFFHFSGFVHDDPAALSRHQNRVRAEAGSAMETIAQEYAAEIACNRPHTEAYADEYSYSRYHDGTLIDIGHRRAYRDLPNAEKATLGDPFDPATPQRLNAYVDPIQALQAEHQRISQENHRINEDKQRLLEALAQANSQLSRISTLEDELHRCGSKLHEAQRYIEEVQISASFRLGRMLTAPLRLLRSGKR
ncbi:hypothetical protein H0A70_18240 [Alcaligenaceae bacterium]|nr:hypothetical protein [Alcaligenaceae bacterium]